MTAYINKDYSNFMFRQLLICLFVHFLFFQNAIAATPSHQVLTIPSDEKSEERKDSDKSLDLIQDQGLNQTNETASIEYPTFHLKPSPSVTITGSHAYNFDEDDAHTWLGVHLAPWMYPTYRVQLGLDIYDHYGWLQAAYHALPRRTGQRFYWGGGVSAMVDTREEFRPLMRLKNYFIFGVGGFEWQIQPQQSLRIEASYHQSTEFSMVRGTAGWTLYF